MNIKTDGKDLRALANEVREMQITNAAKKLGLDTKDKTPKDLLKEMMINHPDEVKKLKLLPFHEGPMMGHHKRGKEAIEN